MKQKMTKEEVLKKYFGYTGFREGQGELIDRILAREDVLGIMPTGAGKSLCFQIPALMMPGITLVISPLVSLMKDQVRALVDNGIRAAYINSSLTYPQTIKAIANAKKGIYKIIYVAPERLEIPAFLEFAAEADISMVTVDEAHCVSQWGQDFRPSYLKIPEFLEKLKKRPVLNAFTATATAHVRRDMIEILKLQKPYIITTGFDRPNLFFKVLEPTDKFRALTGYLSRREGKSGIVYCSTRKNVEDVCQRLCELGFSATRYHAGLSEEERFKNQDDFLYDNKQIMVATNAFGMGIDKSNVNFVIHYNMPLDVESYYQEAGRAGRDGSPADCILLFGARDVQTNRFLIENGTVQDGGELSEKLKERAMERLRKMTLYCREQGCLRAYLMKYFGEKKEDYCGNCGNCMSGYEQIDVLKEAQKIAACVNSLQGRFGIGMATGVLRGSREEKMMRFSHIPTYGSLKECTEREIRQIIHFMLSQEYLYQTDSEYPLLQLGKRFRELTGKKELLMRRAKEKESLKKDAPEDSELLKRLKALRQKIARAKGVPAYVIFTDATLSELSRRKPGNMEELLEVSGIGAVKAERYGKKFLEELKK